jgi:small ligand-binding sensory domain FIST
MGHLQAIITSPSTVAIDAARQQLPVAVVAHQLHLANYDPLTLIRSGADWQAFVESALDAASREALVRHGCRFIGRTLLPDGAAERIVIDMMAHVPRKLVHRT